MTAVTNILTSGGRSAGDLDGRFLISFPFFWMDIHRLCEPSAPLHSIRIRSPMLFHRRGSP